MFNIGLITDEFGEKYQEYYEKAKKIGLNDSIIEEIYEDYSVKTSQLKKDLNDEIEKITKDKPDEIVNIYGRVKSPNHVIGKILRKIGGEDKAKYRNINKDNYLDVITDVIGVRILILCKDDWAKVYRYLVDIYKSFEEIPVAYVFYGDRDIFKNKIRTECLERGYRSQHYIVMVGCIKMEIQVRSLAEEVYGEYDHKIRYPKRMNNKFLHRYNIIISKLISDIDDLISTSLAIEDEVLLDSLNSRFSEDSYRNYTREVNEDINVDKFIAVNDEIIIRERSTVESIIKNKIKREE